MKKLLIALAIVTLAVLAAYKLATPRRGGGGGGALGRDGRPVAITPAAGKITLVHFWGTWCGPCRAELPSFIAFADAHRDQVRYIAVADDRSFEAVDRFLSEQGMKMDTLIDPSGTVLRSWKVTAIPTTFVLDSKGNVASRYVGLTNWNDRFIADEVLRTSH